MPKKKSPKNSVYPSLRFDCNPGDRLTVKGISFTIFKHPDGSNELILQPLSLRMRIKFWWDGPGMKLWMRSKTKR